MFAWGIAAGAILAIMGGASASGNVIYWDPNHTGGTGGDGQANWDTTDNFWFNGTIDTTWHNSDLTDIADFGNATSPEAVTLTEAIDAGGLDFTSGNYTIRGNSIILRGTPIITVVAGASAVINSVLAGNSGLTVGDGTHTGILILGGDNTYTGATNINAGIVQVAEPEVAGTTGPLGAGGTISFGGGTLQYSSVNQFDYSSRFSTASSQIYRIDTNGQSVTWATPLTSAGGTLTVSDTNSIKGSVTLSAINTYSGATTVASGTLIVSGSITGSTTTVEAGGTLAGTGSAGPVNIQSGGTIAPGAASGTIGTLHTGALTLNGTYQLTLNSTTSTSDDLMVTGNLTLSGATLALTDLALGPGGVNLTIAQYTGTLSGTFTGLDQGALLDHGLYSIDYGTKVPGAITLVAVPEANTWAVLAGGVAMLALFRHRRSDAARRSIHLADLKATGR